MADERGVEGGATIWMGAIQPEWDEPFLFSLFAATGEVKSVKMMRNNHTGVPSGYAFIEFQSKEAAQRVLELYNGCSIPNTNLVFRLNWGSRNKGSNATHAQQFSLFVGDLSPEVTDQMLLGAFQSQYGTCRDAKVIIDPCTGQSKGYGFVRFLDKAESLRAMREMQGTFVGTRQIRIGEATQRRSDMVSPRGSGQRASLSQRPSAVARGAQQPQQEETTQHESPQPQQPPPPQQRQGRRKQPDLTPLQVYAPLQGFPGAPNAQQQQQQQQQQRSPANGPESTTSTVFIGGLAPDVTEDAIRQHFCKCGRIESVKIPLNRGCGFVSFSTREEAENAIRNLHGTQLGGSNIRLDWGKFSGSGKNRGSNHPASPQAQAMPPPSPLGTPVSMPMIYTPAGPWPSPVYFSQPSPHAQGAYYFGQYYMQHSPGTNAGQGFVDPAAMAYSSAYPVPMHYASPRHEEQKEVEVQGPLAPASEDAATESRATEELPAASGLDNNHNSKENLREANLQPESEEVEEARKSFDVDTVEVALGATSLAGGRKLPAQKTGKEEADAVAAIQSNV